MVVRARPPERLRIPAEVERYVRQKEQYVTSGNDYQVHGIRVSKSGLIYFQIVSDDGLPTFSAALLFDVIDTSIPSDWQCNSFPESESGTLLAIGPEFLVNDELAVARMIDFEPYEVELFWKRLQALKAEAEKLTATKSG